MNREPFGDIQYKKSEESWTGSIFLRQFASFGETLDDDELEHSNRRGGLLP